MTYNVQTGDTLGKIAAKFLGDATRFKEILAVNPQITNPNLIKVGQQITLPSGASRSPSIPSSPTAPLAASKALIPVSAVAPSLPESSFMSKVKDFYSNKKVMVALALGLAGVLVMIKMKQRKLAKA